MPKSGEISVDEPRWRTFLCWGSVFLFLTLPISILVIRIVADTFPDSHWNESLEKAKFVVPYFQSLSALVFGLAGLNVWDRRNGAKQPAKKEPEPRPEAK